MQSITTQMIWIVGDEKRKSFISPCTITIKNRHKTTRTSERTSIDCTTVAFGDSRNVVHTTKAERAKNTVKMRLFQNLRYASVRTAVEVKVLRSGVVLATLIYNRPHLSASS